MNRHAARTIELEKLAAREATPREVLPKALPVDESILETLIDANENKWTVRSLAFWEDEQSRKLRISVSVDDGGLLSSLFPVNATASRQI